jgi:Ni/Fe-hydrogenase subunit HybB-like protein
MHIDVPKIEVEEQIAAGSLRLGATTLSIATVMTVIGVFTFGFGLMQLDRGRVWGSYLSSLLIFTGLSCGGIIISAIFQVVKAKWSMSARRLTEAGVVFLPIAYILILATWFGRFELYPWASAPRPGTESWMQPIFVYFRFGGLLLILFSFLGRFVWLSLKCDRLMREGAWERLKHIQNYRSFIAPIVIITYGLIYSLFAFEMVMSMDKIWMSNLFGAFYVVGNIYISWAFLILLLTYFCTNDQKFSHLISKQIFWDVGKLTFGFCMIWGYFFLSQFLPQWYGNLPEETQWLILRTREEPWKSFGYLVFGCSFVVPFILLLSREIKKVPYVLSIVALVIIFGVWCEKLITILPYYSPKYVNFGFFDIGIFLGFLGIYLLCVHVFLSRVPRVAYGSMPL